MYFDDLFTDYSFFRGVKEVDFKEVENVVSHQAKKMNGVQKKSEHDFLSMYHIKSDKYQDLLYYASSSYLDVQEIMIIYAPNEQETYQKVLTHIDNQKKSFEGYGVEQTKLLSDATVVQFKDYVVCIVSADEKIKQVILDLFH